MKRLRTRLDVLSEKPFRRLFLGWSLSSAGDALMPVATTFAVLHLGDASDLGLVLGAYWASRMLFVVAGGVWADRLPRRRVMIGADLARAGVQAGVAFAFFTDTAQVWHLIVSSAILGIGAAFFNPASAGLIPALVTPERLQEANGLLALTRNATAIFGPAAAGLLVTTAGYGVVYAVDGASFGASLASLVAMGAVPERRSQARQAFLADAREGLREVGRHRWIVVTILCDSVTNLALGAYLVLGPVLVAREFGGAREWGFIMTAAAIGGVAGGALAIRFKPQRPLLTSYVLKATMPLQLTGVALALPLPALMVGGGLLVMSLVIANAFWTTMEQQHVRRDSISRVDAFAWMSSLVIMPIGLTAAGPLGAAVGERTTLLGASTLAAAAISTALSVRSVRGLRRHDALLQVRAHRVDVERTHG